jgi:hypothetical protein
LETKHGYARRIFRPLLLSKVTMVPTPTRRVVLEWRSVAAITFDPSNLGISVGSICNSLNSGARPVAAPSLAALLTHNQEGKEVKAQIVNFVWIRVAASAIYQFVMLFVNARPLTFC